MNSPFRFLSRDASPIFMSQKRQGSLEAPVVYKS